MKITFKLFAMLTDYLPREVGGKARVGFPTPSKKLELHSQTMVDWGWPEYAAPVYVPSHVDEQRLDRKAGEMVLVATFRLPTLIHTRSANSKWLTELSNTNPVWIHPSDAQRLGVQMGDLLRVATRTGYYVNAAWVTEGVRPGLIACSHHMGRWTVSGDQVSGNHWQLHDVDLRKVTPTAWLMRRVKPTGAFASKDKDSEKVWWSSGGVHQNMTFPVQPDPISGMHCWHQKVVVTKAEAVTWPDGSLGCPEPGMFYTQALVDGYWIVVEAGGQALDYRVSGGGNFRICDTPQPASRTKP